MSKLVDKGFTISCGNNEDDDFFQKWVEYIKPKHGLTKTEQRVLAEILRHRYILSKSINDEALLEETFLNKIHRDAIRSSLKMSGPQFNGIMGKLRDLKILVQNKYTEMYKMNPNFIVTPNDSGSFKLLMVFNYDVNAFKEDKGETGSRVQSDS